MKKAVLENRKVKIPDETIELYEKHYQHGDYKAILDLINDESVNLMAVSRACKGGDGSPIVVDGIIKYYNEVVVLNRIYDYNAE